MIMLLTIVNTFVLFKKAVEGPIPLGFFITVLIQYKRRYLYNQTIENSISGPVFFRIAENAEQM